MRMLPNLSISSRRSSTGSRRSSKQDQRRSWHVGTANDSTHTSRRRSSGAFRKTWHFHRHSNSCHTHLTNHSNVSNNNHNNNHDAEANDIKFEDEHDVNTNTAVQRKSFSYASHVTTEQETAAQADSTSFGGSSAVPLQVEGKEPNNEQQQQQHRRLSSSSSRKGWFIKVKTKTGQVLHFLFPGCRPLHGQQQHRTSVPHHRSLSPAARAGISPERIQETLEVARTMEGEEGLRAAGFEFRRMPCAEHRVEAVPVAEESEENISTSNNGDGPDSTTDINVGEHCKDNVDESRSKEVNNHHQNSEGQDSAKAGIGESHADQERQPPKLSRPINELVLAEPPAHFCRQCCCSLFHIESDTQIDNENRRQFIADGAMYDAVAKLCQENAQEVMVKKYGMVWVTVCGGARQQEKQEEDHNPHLKQGKHEPIRALVNAEHPLARRQMLGDSATIQDRARSDSEQEDQYSSRPTILIATGKGKVRAGVFSRQHLLLSGMECSTALPLIHEARKRKLNIVIIDPNAHGDRLGMITFEKSMAQLFSFWEQPKQQLQHNNTMTNLDLYILSHSASGSHLVRYLLDEKKCTQYLPHVRAIAFTDSTHNVQWARAKGHQGLVNMLESDSSIYFRCATSGTSENWSMHHAGQEAPTDQFWRHRFGSIRTCWAGTKEHSLTNWHALNFIWEHFDRFLYRPDDQEG